MRIYRCHSCCELSGAHSRLLVCFFSGAGWTSFPPLPLAQGWAGPGLLAGWLGGQTCETLHAAASNDGGRLPSMHPLLLLRALCVLPREPSRRQHSDSQPVRPAAAIIHWTSHPAIQPSGRTQVLHACGRGCEQRQRARSTTPSIPFLSAQRQRKSEKEKKNHIHNVHT